MGSVLSVYLFTNLWCDVQALLNDLAPETGTVTDNSDGSHSTVYAITRAGIYRMAIQSAPLNALASRLREHPQMFGTCSRPWGSGDLPLQTRPPYGGRVSSESFTSYPQYSLSAPLTNPRTHVHRFGSVLGAGSPHFLDIKTGAADESKTYIYGSLLAVAAGKTSFAYVQTRDKYGNNIRVNPDDTGSEGPDNVQFELCNEVRPVCVHVPLAVLCSAQPEGAGLGASPADTFELPRTAARAWHALCHA